MIQRDYLIIGAGLGGAAVCETIRQYDKKGSILLVGNESALPYHRSRLLDKVLIPKAPDVNALTHLPRSWYDENNVDLRLETIVTQVNLERRLAVLNSGLVIEFRKACLAMGSRAHRPKIAGSNLGNILTLRTLRDTLALRELACHGKNIIIIGSGFVATETATALIDLGIKVQIMSRQPHLWSKLLDPQTAAWLTAYFESHGIALIHEALNGFEGKTVLRNIQTKSGRSIPAGAVLLAMGVDMNLGLFNNTPLATPLGAPVNDLMETDEKGIYAVGDIALYPDPLMGSTRRTPHWETTLEQAAIAGANITGKKRQKFKGIPHHATRALDLNFEFLGEFRTPHTRFEIEGDRDKKQFTLRYYHGQKLKGILLCNADEATSTAAKVELIQAAAPPVRTPKAVKPPKLSAKAAATAAPTETEETAATAET